jgi:hypothetical protein
MKKLFFFYILSHSRNELDPELDPDPDLDPLARSTDPEIRIRTKISRIPNTGKKLKVLKFLRENVGNYFRKLYKFCCSFIELDVPYLFK